MRFSKTIALFIFLLPLWASGHSSGPYRIKAETEKAKDSSLRKVKSEAHYKQSPEKVWELLNLFTQFPKFIPRVKSCESMGVARGTEQIYFEIDLPLGLPNIWNIIALKRDEKKGEFQWEMLQGNIKLNRGEVAIEKEGDGSVVHLDLELDTGKLIPQMVVAWSAKHFVPKVLKAIGDRLTDPKLVPPTPSPTP